MTSQSQNSQISQNNFDIRHPPEDDMGHGIISNEVGAWNTEMINKFFVSTNFV